MKRQKGFTLIELLAVIVILAIIALIATPMIMDVIDKAKKGSAEASMNGYVDAIEKYSVIGQLDAVTVSAGVYDVKETNGENANFLKNVDVKGEKPTEGWVAINNQGYVEAAALKFKSYSGAPIVYVKESVGKAATKNADTILTKPEATTGEGTTKTAIEVALENAKAAIGQ